MLPRTARVQPQPSPRQSPPIPTSSSPPQSRACDRGQLPAHSIPQLGSPSPTAYIYTHPHGHTHPSTDPLLCSAAPRISSSHNSEAYIQLQRDRTELVAAMARCGFLSLPRLVLLLLVLGDIVAMTMARPIAEAPSPAVAAEGPGVVARPGGGRQDRSIAGAEVILAGFAAAVVAVVFLYIRVTRKSNHGAAGMAEKA